MTIDPPAKPQLPDRRLAVVTGAASGIGLATAQALGAAGTAVIGVDLAAAPPGAAHVGWVAGDVSAESTWDAVQAACLAAEPAGADCLVCCAGNIVVSPFLETPVDDWVRLFEINVIGVIRGMQTLMPAMIERGRGAIAVVCSVNSFVTEQEMSAYSTSKAALLHAIRSAALEHARHGLRINAICPGVIDTPLLQRHFDSLDDPQAARREAERRTPTGRILTPQEVAAALCFLVSDAASGFSGSAVVVDGGLTTTYDFDSLGE